MRRIDPIRFTRIMALPEHERGDLLEFLGASPASGEQIDRLIVAVTAQSKKLRQAAEAASAAD